MTLHDWLRLAVILGTAIFAAFVAFQIWHWHTQENSFSLMELLMAQGKDKRQHVSRAAVGEMVALVATTSGYLGAMAAKPDTFSEATAVYGAIWTARGAFSTYLRSKAK